MNVDIKNTLEKNIAALTSDRKEYEYIPRHARSMPDTVRIRDIMNLVKSIVFPGFFGETEINDDTHEYHLGVCMEKLYKLLCIQIRASLHFSDGSDAAKTSSETALAFINKIPEIKRLLATDIKAMFDGDPAATCYDEIIYCYPGVQAMIHYRAAHELLLAGVQVLPRIITELAHSETGIDIHPGAVIGEYFSIDHGTGIVIGETCIIGNHVRLYQGVTLGARSLATNADGVIAKEPRHPILEDNVVVYSNSTILGRITIGHHTVIGGNIWQVYSVAPYSRIVQTKAKKTSHAAFTDGLGI
ncbi:MAG: serine acetyltransferase [Prevotellaceae bacterium]|jgi:serine O-acetyltransferase|nr:serine acetyltransferase [Prevotellaceae bacterium]